MVEMLNGEEVAQDDSRESEEKRMYDIALHNAQINRLGEGWIDCQGTWSKTAFREVGIKIIEAVTKE